MKINYLKTFMNTIPMGEYKSVKDNIIEKCFITDDIWKNWLTGRTSVPELAKPIINEIAGHDIFSKKDHAAISET